MNKVTTINLNGNAYQLEESGFEALRSYLDSAAQRLEGNPDKDEIIADIECAIADKFRALLGPHKTVVVAAEVATIIAEMGPVQDPSGPAPDAQGAGAPGPGAQGGASAPGGASVPRRLYKIKDGAMIGGVCSGLAAFFGIDVSIVRILFAFLTIVWGFGLLLYILMLFLIPSAVTPAEKAAAFGGGPSTAEEFIRRAKEGYYEGMRTFHDKGAHREWKRRFKSEMRGWKTDFQREVRANRAEWAQNWSRYWAEHPQYHFGASFTVTLLEVFSLVVTLLCFYAVYSLFVHGSVFGAHLPGGIPLWLGIVGVVLLCKLVTSPAKAMRRAYRYGGGYGVGCAAVWDTFLGIGAVILALWFVGHNPAGVHDALHDAAAGLHRALDSIRDGWNKR
jgi:phage shock protein PspC (stress-responsive transcriptional regulator)